MMFQDRSARFSARSSGRFVTLALLFVTAFAAESRAAQFTLTWKDNSTNETGFRIERAPGLNAATGFLQIATVGPNVVSYVDASLPNSASFTYRLRAFNAAGSSAYSNVATGTTPPPISSTTAASPPAANTAPTITNVIDRTINEDATTGAIAFTVGDAQTAATSLAVSATSSNTTLIPASRVVLGGSGASRTVTITPAANLSGTSTITLRVSDGSLVATDTFVLTVKAVNDAPTISAIANRTISQGTSTGAIAFTVGDIETSAASLTLTRSSSNAVLVPIANIVFGGSGAGRTVTVTPASGQSGSATITVNVSDGTTIASRSFVLTVTVPNTPPTITSIASRSIAMNGTSGAIAFTIGDTATAASSLTLSRNSSNTALIPLANIVFGGSGANRTVTIRPSLNSTGSATISIEVGDGSLKKAISFVVTVSVNLTYLDIGTPVIVGSHTVSGSTIEIRGAGAGIWGTSDQFRFAHHPIQGDSELTVRVTGIVHANTQAKAGLMYRASTAANAAYVYAFVSPYGYTALQYRTSSGVAAAQKYSAAAALPRWLKLTRSGDTFYAYHSADGVTWNLVDFVTVDLPDTAAAGLAVTSHSVSAATTATFQSLGVD